ncbi:tannase/feruloyl esterase family alpha/beta hydrolase [Methylocapsa sp. S129]|uniref:tannase/feruloyl esterase family alpha/beta hydrolase n=1 Tax=Methylocapsa sp. S129 TaxID=1641869 RepID=UPI00131D5425|nr:tannase/feruloyl esterase family alpha/beta hydrolase [Methylocapsa sp. S129]
MSKQRRDRSAQRKKAHGLSFFHGLAIVSAAAFSCHAATAVAADCQSLAALSLPNAKIDAAQEIDAGSYTPAGAKAIAGLPAFCRIHGIIAPAPGSQIGFELWLPRTSWNHKLEMFGNGGYSSDISYADMADRLQTGYASVATDTGHIGSDPAFAAGHPESIVDWGHRAVHETAQKAKLLVAAYYGAAPVHAYFKGCSTGGHQALMEAQRFPGDFDGIIAGDPGNNRTHLNAGFLWQYIANHPHGDDAHPIIPASKLSMITQAVVKACQGLNGSQDGGLPTDNFLTDPGSCHFDPATIACKGADAADCLTAPQAQALKAMYDGARDPQTGERIFFGWPPGSEGSSAVVERLPGWSLYWADPAKADQPARLTYWRDWAFDDKWNWWNFDWSRDMRAADAKLAPIINANSPDLETFRKLGGKLLEYHGLADPVAPPLDSISYYEHVVADQKEKHADLSAGAFYRLFLVPGMAHCSGGPGADRFDAQSALENWVERGAPPDSMIASHADGEGAATHVAFSRPLCPYPRQARYDGKGDPTLAGSFVCRDDGRSREPPSVGPDYSK